MSVPEIDVQELARRHGDGAVILDVRNPDEYEQGHVPGAILIPLGEIQDRVAEVPTECTVHVVCAMGGRSRKAAEFLVSCGIDAINVSGGTVAWIEAGLPVVAGSDPE
ncbi:MAG: rhodanese-like domain-containing protein [Acidimicrobiales bacterium]|nr:rhodanese-like domain-containing protein [Acidimicrobiales bacterium]